MLFKKQAVHDAWAATDRTLDFKITIKDKTYTATDITNLTFDSGAMNGAALTIGSTYQNTIKITFSHLIEGLELLDEVTPQIGIRLPDNTWDFTNLGVFVLDSEVVQDRNNNTTTLSASDRMCMLGGTYESKLTYPAPISDIAIEVANLAGVKINEADFARIPNTEINSFGSVTYRDAIGYVAQFAGGFATFDRDGLLDVRTLSDPNFVISPAQYQSKGLNKNESFYRIGGITCTVNTIVKDESGNETQETKTLQAGSSSGTQIALINPSMTQVLLDGLYQQLQDINFYPFALNWFGDPSLEVGDWITIKDMTGNEFKTPNLLYSLTFGGGLSAVSKADTTVTSSASFVYKGQLSQDVENIRQHMNASGNIVSEGIDPPGNPKPGDIWFAKDGPDTIIKTWVIDPETGIGSWQEQVSTKPDEKLQESVDNAVKDAADALDKSNTAVENSNKAVSDAGFATDIANDAKASAADATGKAAEAVSKAEDAQSDATTAINNAQDALDKYDNLEASVETEITNINGELSQKVSQTEYNNLKGTVENNSTQITQNQHDIQLKANQAQVDTINKTVQNQQTEINQNANQIELKADQSQVDTINKTVQQNTANIGVNANAIKLKADLSTVDNLAGRVTKTEGELTVQAGQIAQTVSKTELNSTLSGYATQTWTQGQIKTTADNINLSVQKVQSNIDNLSAGARNYLLNSAELLDSDISKVIDVNGNAISEPFIINNDILNGSEIIASFEAEYTGTSNGTITFQYMNVGDKGWGKLGSIALKKGKSRYIFKGISPKITDLTSVNEIRIFCINVNDGHLTVTKGMYASGNVDAGWSLAPEDTASTADYANLEIKVNGIQGTVANKADQSQVTQLANQITSTVSGLGQTNLVYNSDFAVNIEGWSSNIGISLGSNQYDHYNGSNSLGIHATNLAVGSWRYVYSKKIDVKPGYKYSASATLFVTGAAKPEATSVRLEIDFFDSSGSRVGYPAANFDLSKYATKQQLKINGVSVPETAVTACLSVQLNGNINLILNHPMLVADDTVGPYSPDNVSQSQITQMKDDINLRVQKGNVINQINISPESILIAGQKVHITGQTTIDNAVIKDAMIANLSASKLTAGTIDAGKINVVNLNASNITTGTIAGSNLSINLNTGEVLFTKGSIKSTNGKLNINVDDGTFAQTDTDGSGVHFEHGGMYLGDKSFLWSDSDTYYGFIRAMFSLDGDDQKNPAMYIQAKNGLSIGTENSVNIAGSRGSGSKYTAKKAVLFSEGMSVVTGGDSLWSADARMGASGKYPGGGSDWTINDSTTPGTSVYLRGSSLIFNAAPGLTASSNFAVATDANGYLMSMTTYKRTYSSGANMTVTANGVFGRISSASKYKLDISTVSNITEQAYAFLAVEPKQWFDKSETEDMAKELTEGDSGSVDSANVRPYYGYVAEDLYSAGLDNVVLRDSNTGELEGIQYDRLIIYLHQLTKELYQRVNDLEAKIYSMEANK